MKGVLLLFGSTVGIELVLTILSMPPASVVLSDLNSVGASLGAVWTIPTRVSIIRSMVDLVIELGKMSFDGVELL